MLLLTWTGIAAGQQITAPAPKAHDLGDILVIGEKIDEFIRKNPSQAVSMTAAEIEKRNFLQVYEVIGSLPGVDVQQSSGGLGARISIRGGGGSGSVLVLIDGRPASTMQYGGVDLSSIPIDIVKKITVFKPPVPVWLGPGSSAGAIYIETRKKQRVKTSKSGRVRISGGSYGQAALSATTKIDHQENQYMISGGLVHKDGKRENSQKDQGHLSLHYGKKAGSSNFQLNGKAFVSDHGVSGPTYNPTPDANQRYEKASLDMKLEGMASPMTDYALKTYADVKALDETSQAGEKSELNTFTGGLGTDFFILNPSNENELRMGGLVEHSQVDHSITGEHERNLFSAHGEYNIRTTPFIYTLGARSDYTSDFHFSPGGHAGVSWEISQKTLVKTNIGYSENVPSFGQLYQPSHGSSDQVRGNPDLEKEKVISFNLGISQTVMEKNKITISLFRTESRDLIKYLRGADMISRPENIDKAYKQGVETLINFTFTPKTRLDVNYIWQETENKANDKKLSYSPAHTLKLIFKTGFKTGTKLEWTTRGYSDQFSDTANTEAEKLDNYITTDIKLMHPLTLFKKKTLTFVHIHNLFDKKYASHYGYPDDGIKFQCGVSLNF